jgi:drug/metabolite transporter (DMT)-like permease
MPLVTAGLHALVAFAAGAIVAWLVDSERPVRWAIFLAVLYVFFGTFGYQLAQQRSFRDRSAQLLGAVIMGVSCLVGAVFTLRGTRYKQPPTPDLSCELNRSMQHPLIS